MESCFQWAEARCLTAIIWSRGALLFRLTLAPLACRPIGLRIILSPFAQHQKVYISIDLKHIYINDKLSICIYLSTLPRDFCYICTRIRRLARRLSYTDGRYRRKRRRLCTHTGQDHPRITRFRACYSRYHHQYV